MNYSQKIMDPSLFHINVEAAQQQQQQQQQSQNQNAHQGNSHFGSPSQQQQSTLQIQSNARMQANIMSYDRVPFPVVHNLMNPINDQ